MASAGGVGAISPAWLAGATQVRPRSGHGPPSHRVLTRVVTLHRDRLTRARFWFLINCVVDGMTYVNKRFVRCYPTIEFQKHMAFDCLNCCEDLFCVE